MNPDRADDYLGHILEAAQLARSYVEGMSKDQFLADRRTQQAVIFNLLIIGEAATQLSNARRQFVEQHPHIAWKSMTGMRNRLVHGYFTVDLQVVWDTVQDALPELVEQLVAIQNKRQA